MISSRLKLVLGCAYVLALIVLLCVLFWPKWTQFQDARVSSAQTSNRIEGHIAKLSQPLPPNDALQYRGFVAQNVDPVRFRTETQRQLNALIANSGARVLGLSVSEAEMKDGLERHDVTLQARGNLQVLLAIVQGLGAQSFPILIMGFDLEAQTSGERRKDQNITLTLQLAIWVETSS